MRGDDLLIAPGAVRIDRAIPYDYLRRFGPADPAHAMRSRLFDRVVAVALGESGRHRGRARLRPRDGV